MKNIFKKIISLAIIFGALFGIIATTADASFYPTAGQTYLTRNPMGTTDTVLYLSQFLEPNSNVPYTMSYLNSNIEYVTIDPTIPGRSEFISFTGIIQNSDGSAALTGVTRGLTGSYPYTSSSTLAVTHGAQAQVILSDSPQVFYQYAGKQNNETITGSWSFPPPTSGSSPATESYVLSVISGTSTLSFNQLIVAGNASGTISKGNVVVYASTSQEWIAANASTTKSNVANTEIGIAQGNATNGISIPGGILLKGLDGTQTGMTPGVTYFVSTSTPGGISTLSSSAVIGQALTSATLYFDPYFLNPSAYGNNTLFGSNTYNGASTFSGTTTLAATTTFLGLYPAYQIIGYVSTTTANSSLTVPIATSSNFRIDISSVMGGDQYGLLQFNGDAQNDYGFIGFANGLQAASASSSGATAIRLYCAGSGATFKSFFDIAVENSLIQNQKQATYNGNCLANSTNAIFTNSGIGTWIATGTQATSFTWSTDSGSLGTTTITVYGTPNQ